MRFMRMRALSLVGSFRPTQLDALPRAQRMSEYLLLSTLWMDQSWRPEKGVLPTFRPTQLDVPARAQRMSEYLLLSTLRMDQSWRPEKFVLPIGVSPHLDSLNGSWRTEKGSLPCVFNVSEWRSTFFMIDLIALLPHMPDSLLRKFQRLHSKTKV